MERKFVCERVFSWMSIIFLIVLLLDIEPAIFLSVMVLILLFMFLQKVKDPIKIVPFLFVFALIIREIAVFLIDTPIVSDFCSFYKGAIAIFEGKSLYDPSLGGYYELWGFNTGIAIYYGILLKICKSVRFLKSVNSLLDSGTVLLIFVIAYRIFHNIKGAMLAALSYAFCPFNILYMTVLSNQPSSLFCLMLGILILSDEKCKRLFQWMEAGIFIGVAYILRPDVLPVILSVIFCLVYKMIICKDKYKIIIHIVIFLTGWYSIRWLISNLIILLGINPEGLNNSFGLYKIAVGLNIESHGLWNQADMDLLIKGNITLQFLLERIKSHSIWEYFRLLIEKMRLFWLENPLYWSIGHWENKEVQNLIYQINLIYWRVVYFLGSFSMMKILRKKNFQEFRYTFFPICMICVSCIFLLIEVQPRYRYSFSVLLFISLAYIYSDLEKIICYLKSTLL